MMAVCGVESKPCERLRALREQLRLSLRDVQTISRQLADEYANPSYVVHASRLCEYETKEITPSAHHLYVMSVCYRTAILELLSWYVPVNNTVADWERTQIRPTHSVSLAPWEQDSLARNFEKHLDKYRGTSLGKLIAEWGLLPLGLILRLTKKRYSYAYVGAEDYTMYPLLPPGSFLQVDECRNRPTDHTWTNEYERPIYLVETLDGLRVSWCDLQDGHLVLQPHSLSPASVRIYRHPQEAQIIGQVVGISTRLQKLNPLAKTTRRL